MESVSHYKSTNVNTPGYNAMRYVTIARSVEQDERADPDSPCTGWPKQ